MSLRFHEIAESNHRILNPLSDAKLMQLGQICGLQPGVAQLDLACGKGEMLCRWAAEFGISGIGVDISGAFLQEALVRASELLVFDRVQFVQGDAAAFARTQHGYDIVSCIGASWIGGGLLGTLELIGPALKNAHSLVLIGEPYWIDPPPPEAVYEWDVQEHEYSSLDGTLDRIDAAGYDLIEMVMASPDDWDRYAAAQWRTVSDWLRDNPDDPEGPALRRWIQQDRKTYLKYARRYYGWGVFVLRMQA